MSLEKPRLARSLSTAEPFGTGRSNDGRRGESRNGAVQPREAKYQRCEYWTARTYPVFLKRMRLPSVPGCSVSRSREQPERLRERRERPTSSDILVEWTSWDSDGPEELRDRHSLPFGFGSAQLRRSAG